MFTDAFFWLTSIHRETNQDHIHSSLSQGVQTGTAVSRMQETLLKIFVAHFTCVSRHVYVFEGNVFLIIWGILLEKRAYLPLGGYDFDFDFYEGVKEIATE